MNAEPRASVISLLCFEKGSHVAQAGLPQTYYVSEDDPDNLILLPPPHE